MAALEVVRGSLAVETDERLAALTPEIAALGSELGLKEAVAEFQEAGRQLAGLGTVPWSTRAAALEHLLSLIGPVFLAGASGSRGRRKAVAVLESIARLPMGPSGNALDELRSHWHEILPMLIAVVERFPDLAGRSLDHALHEGITACGITEGETVEKIFSLCSTPSTGRLQLAERSLDSMPDPMLLQALTYLLSARRPERIPDAVRPLGQGARDRLILRLVRFRWIAPAKASPLLILIADTSVRRENGLLASSRGYGLVGGPDHARPTAYGRSVPARHDRGTRPLVGMRPCPGPPGARQDLCQCPERRWA